MLRIYVKHRYTNEVSYLDIQWKKIYWEFLDKYIRLNDFKFLYITNIKNGKA